MKATLVLHEKRLVASATAIAELKVWQVPRSRDYPTARKFSLFFIVDGEVVVGIDNHKPKGPHLHVGGREEPYVFTTVEQLLDDFWALVRKAGFTP